MNDDDIDDSCEDDDNHDGAEGVCARAVVLTVVVVVIVINSSTPLLSTTVRSAVSATAVSMSRFLVWICWGRSGISWMLLGLFYALRMFLGFFAFRLRRFGIRPFLSLS